MALENPSMSESRGGPAGGLSALRGKISFIDLMQSVGLLAVILLGCVDHELHEPGLRDRPQHRERAAVGDDHRGRGDRPDLRHPGRRHRPVGRLGTGAVVGAVGRPRQFLRLVAGACDPRRASVAGMRHRPGQRPRRHQAQDPCADRHARHHDHRPRPRLHLFGRHQHRAGAEDLRRAAGRPHLRHSRRHRADAGAGDHRADRAVAHAASDVRSTRPAAIRSPRASPASTPSASSS